MQHRRREELPALHTAPACPGPQGRGKGGVCVQRLEQYGSGRSPGGIAHAAHLRLAKLEKQGKLKAVVTQNIDGLHQAAGSKTVYELHGSTLRNYCTRCGAFYDVDYIANSTGVPRCEKCGGIVKPDVVLYEEGLDEEVLSGAVNAIRHADTLIIGGTSLVVYPAAGLIRYFRGDHLVVINMQPTGADAQADLCIAKPIGQVLSEDVVLE